MDAAGAGGLEIKVGGQQSGPGSDSLGEGSEEAHSCSWAAFQGAERTQSQTGQGKAVPFQLWLQHPGR